MSLIEDPHKAELRAAGWHSRGYLPHFDGIEIPQFITFHLADAVPRKVIELRREGQFWFDDYFDRYNRNEEHFRKTLEYIENNPVKAGLCAKASDWPFSSAWFRKAKQEKK